MSGSHCGITPPAVRGSAPACSLTRVHSLADRGPELLPFSSYAQSTRSPSGPPLPGAASGQCLGRASSERESFRKAWLSRAGCGPDCHGLVIYTTGQQVVYTEGFLGPSGSSSVIYVRICNVAGFWRMFILIVCQTLKSMLPATCQCCNYDIYSCLCLYVSMCRLYISIQCMYIKFIFVLKQCDMTSK